MFTPGVNAFGNRPKNGGSVRLRFFQWLEAVLAGATTGSVAFIPHLLLGAGLLFLEPSNTQAQGGGVITTNSTGTVFGSEWRYTGIRYGDLTIFIYGQNNDNDSQIGVLTNDLSSGSVSAGTNNTVTVGTNSVSFDTNTTVTVVTNSLRGFAPPGSYGGLITNLSAAPFSGLFSARLNAKGHYSAKLRIGAKAFSSTGAFDTNGMCFSLLGRYGTGYLAMALQLVSDGIQGSVSDGASHGSISARFGTFNARSNPCPFAGQYTFSMPGNTSAHLSPAGAGIGKIGVTDGGKVLLTCSLADGTSVSAAVAVSQAGEWPLYIPLYGGKGSLLGLALFTNKPQSDINGSLIWRKPASGGAQLYASGFTNAQEIVGSVYIRPNSGKTALNWTSGEIALSGGDLAEPLTRTIRLKPGHAFVEADDRTVHLDLMAPSGLFKGFVATGADRISARGVLLQKAAVGSGYFLKNGQSGAVQLHAR